MRITIVDYGMGNLRSVAKAFEALGCQTLVTSKVQDIQEAKAIVLPGVGSFGDGMDHLENLSLVGVLRQKVVEERTPFLGICLGMQILARKGYENGMCDGLGWIPGDVRKLEPVGVSLKVPHMGWNDVTAKTDDALFASLGPSPCFYFLHSYRLVCADPQVCVAACDYGGEFTAAIHRGNIFGTQFHPEKSQKPGLQLLRNFVGVASSPVPKK